MRRFGLLVLFALANSLPAQEPITRADLKRGLILTASDIEGRDNPFRTTQMSQTVGLTLQPGESFHPQSVTGGDNFTWTGTINILQASKYQFSAKLHGNLTVKVGEQVVLTGQSKGGLLTGPEVQLPNGFQLFQVSLARIPLEKTVQLDLMWRGPGFQTEPIPYFFFGHLPAQRPTSYLTDLSREHGRLLFEEHSCLKCHKAGAEDAVAKTLAERAGPNLSEIGKRAYPGWLDAWLADPHQLRPNTVMPKMFSTDDKGIAERYAVVAYLNSLGGSVPEGKTPPVNQYRRSIRDGEKLYLTAGCAACHGDKLTQPPTKKKLDDEEDEKPVAPPEDLAYGFGMTDSKGFYLLGHVGSKTSPEALKNYLLNPLATNPHGRMPNMVLNNNEAMDIARFICQQKDEKIATAMPPLPKLKATELSDDPKLANLPPEQQWREVGKRLMTSKGCVNCHTIEAGGQKLAELASAPTLKQLAGSSKACLSGQKDSGKYPGFALTERDRQSLAVFLSSGLNGAGKASPAYSSRVALRRFQCLNCHNRDGEGGFSPELSDQMRLLENAENADDVSPPRLTAAGHKLRTSWFKQLLTQAGRARPWMTLRMPQYGPHNVEFIAEALPKAEGTLPDDSIGKVALTAEKVEAGRTLAGKNGLGCISCHDISGVRGGGTRGPDLARTHERVRLDWYFRWMHQPQRLAPGTKMPQAFLDGKSLLTTVLNGDGDAQIEAMWAYFSLGQGLPLPVGIEPPKGLVLTVKDKPEILRTFMPDNAGTKAIAVGFPGGVNLVFDAATCRLSYAWSGTFLDTSPVWNNRGGAPANLLGPKFWTAPMGFPWAVTESRTPPDFSKRQTDPAYGHQLPQDAYYGGPRLVHFLGYSLDAAGQPNFRYRLTDSEQKPLLTVLEQPRPLPVTVAAGLSRSFALEWPANQSTWLQVGSATTPRLLNAAGEAITFDLKAESPEVSVEGTRLILADAGKATVIDIQAAPKGTVWRFVPVNGGYQALVRLPESATPGKGELRLALWGLPRDDAELLKGLRSK